MFHAITDEKISGTIRIVSGIGEFQIPKSGIRNRRENANRHKPSRLDKEVKTIVLWAIGHVMRKSKDCMVKEIMQENSTWSKSEGKTEDEMDGQCGSMDGTVNSIVT